MARWDMYEDEIYMIMYDEKSNEGLKAIDPFGHEVGSGISVHELSYLSWNFLSKRLTLASETAPQPRLYVLLLGQSADERKSTSLEKTIKHFKDATDRFEVYRGVSSAEGLQKVLEKNTHGLLLSLDEFKQFVSKCRIDSSVLLHTLCYLPICCIGILEDMPKYGNEFDNKCHLSFTYR